MKFRTSDLGAVTGDGGVTKLLLKPSGAKREVSRSVLKPCVCFTFSANSYGLPKEIT